MIRISSNECIWSRHLKGSLDSSSSERETLQDTPVSSRTRSRQAQEEPVKLRKNVRWDTLGPFPVVDQNVTLSVLAKVKPFSTLYLQATTKASSTANLTELGGLRLDGCSSHACSRLTRGSQRAVCC